MWRLWNRPRLVVARRWTGLGDCLISLTGAWRYARDTGRTLAIDWRHSTYRFGPRNLFDIVFEPVQSIGGVPVVSGDDVARHYGGRRYWPEGWGRRAISRASRVGERGDLEQAIATIRGARDVDADVVVFDDCLANAAPPRDEQRLVFASLGPRPAIREEVETFARANQFGRRPVIGVHVRHGSGGYVGDHGAHWQSPGKAVFMLTQAIEAVRQRMVAGADPVILLCTDNAQVEGLMRAAFPTLVTRPKAMVGAGGGELHQQASAAAGLADAVVEMLLLARSDVLLRFPAGSFFSNWAAVMKRPPVIDISGIATVPGLEIC